MRLSRTYHQTQFLSKPTHVVSPIVFLYYLVQLLVYIIFSWITAIFETLSFCIIHMLTNCFHVNSTHVIIEFQLIICLININVPIGIWLSSLRIISITVRCFIAILICIKRPISLNHRITSYEVNLTSPDLVCSESFDSMMRCFTLTHVFIDRLLADCPTKWTLLLTTDILFNKCISCLFKNNEFVISSFYVIFELCFASYLQSISISNKLRIKQIDRTIQLFIIFICNPFFNLIIGRRGA